MISSGVNNYPTPAEQAKTAVPFLLKINFADMSAAWPNWAWAPGSFHGKRQKET
jgi:hypothetical protein